jgi:putative transposase
MARHPRIQFQGAIYHAVFRGNERQNIFRDDRDRQRMLERLAECVEDHGARLYMYCLMSNHVHLLLETPKGNLSAFMGGLLTGYTVYFNRRHRRVGHLMQGRYKSQLVEGNEYLLKLSRYIHFNPVRLKSWASRTVKEKIQYLRRYPWSSYRGYAGLARREPMVDYGPLGRLVAHGRRGQGRAYRSYVELGLAEDDETFGRMVKQSPLGIGTESFMEMLKQRYAQISEGRVKAEDVALRRSGQRAPPDRILAAVADAFGVRPEQLKQRAYGGWFRAAAAYALSRWGDLTQRQAAEWLGLSTGAAVSHQIKRLKTELSKQRGLRQKIEILDGKLTSS